MTGKSQRLIEIDANHWDVSAYCQTLIKLYDAQVRGLAEESKQNENEYLTDHLWDAFCSASESVCRMRAATLSDILRKVELWKRLAPERSPHPTPDEILLMSIVEDLERLHQSHEAPPGETKQRA